MKLFGMEQSFRALLDSHTSEQLTSDEVISTIVQAEWDDREMRKITRGLRNARFRYHASIEEIDYLHPRGLDKNQFVRFIDCSYIQRHESILVCGPTGVGKSFIVSALGNQACMKGYKVYYRNAQKLFRALKLAKADGSYLKEMTKIEKQDLFILDDFGLQPLDNQNSLILLEILEDRHDKHSTVISSQLPVSKWYDIIGENTLADAILDRLINGSHKINLKGESMRKKI